MTINKKLHPTIFLGFIGIVALYLLMQNSLLRINQQIPYQLQSITQAARKNQWLEARQLLGEFDQMWGRGKYYRFDYSRADYLQFKQDLERLRQAVLMRDTDQVEVNTQVMKQLWSEL